MITDKLKGCFVVMFEYDLEFEIYKKIVELIFLWKLQNF